MSSTGVATRSSKLPSAASSQHYRDPLFAAAFLLQLGVVAVVAAVWGYPALVQQLLKADDPSESSVPEDGNMTAAVWMTTLGVSFASALLSSVVCFSLLWKLSHWIVPLAYFCSSTLVTAVCVLVLSSFLGATNANENLAVSYGLGGAASFGSLLLSGAFYYLFVRRYVPFAASTIRTALSAFRAHPGLLGLALLDSFLVALWSALWGVAALGIFHSSKDWKPLPVYSAPCPDDPYRMCQVQDKDYRALAATAFMLLSFFWTVQVLQNILLTTTAGTVATWWGRSSSDSRTKRGNTSSDLKKSLIRSCTYSLGSICFGSLVVAVVQTLGRMLEMASRRDKKKEDGNSNSSRRRQQNHNASNGIATWLLKWLKTVTEYVNSWAFIFVAMYGYSYLQAGKSVAGLIYQRGLSAFVNDRLIYRVLGLTKVAIAIVSGALATAAWVATAASTATTTTPLLWPAGVGFVAGYVWSNTSLFVVESAVRTVIVCFAKDPARFRTCHPVEYQELQRGWATAYPDAWAAQQKKL